jgi:hypothetical protein
MDRHVMIMMVWVEEKLGLSSGFFAFSLVLMGIRWLSLPIKLGSVVGTLARELKVNVLSQEKNSTPGCNYATRG